MRAEPGSFRDRDSHIFYEEDEVLRALTAQGLEDWKLLASSGLYSRYSQSGQLILTELIEDRTSQSGWAGTLRHERVPFISYPYEWTFSMLKDAALLELDL